MTGEEDYFRTVLVVEVLTATEAFNGDFAELAAECIDGNASGDIKLRVVERLSRAEVADLLKAQGSDPNFLSLDGDDEDGVNGHCDTCGAPVDADGCTSDRSHVVALSEATTWWVEPIGFGDGVYGPFDDDVAASQFMDESPFLSDETHKIVPRDPTAWEEAT